MTATKTPPTKRRGSVPLIIGAVVVIGLILVAAALAVLGVLVVTPTSSERQPVVDPTPAAILPDGDTFAFITAMGEGTITIDVAEMLTGEEARLAAVADGAISEGEDLPNDFYISNPGSEVVELAVPADVELIVLDGETLTETPITLAELADAFAGTDTGIAIYGLVPGEFPVTFTVADGETVAVAQVYLP